MAVLTAMPAMAIAQTNSSNNGATGTPPAATNSAPSPTAQASPTMETQSPAQQQQTQANNEGAAATQQQAQANNEGAAAAHQHRNVRRQLASDLKQAGFTDVRVMPESFLVQAKDKSGDPVNMFITPSGMTEVAAVSGDNSNGSDATATNGTSGTDQTANATDDAGMTGASGMFATVPANEKLGSKVIGLTVRNNDDKNIGTIKDIALGHDGAVRAYIVGVGGFLGVGDRYVAVRPSAITFDRDSNNKTWHAKLDATADQLKSAPQFKYSNRT
jgi:hypothetical protein